MKRTLDYYIRKSKEAREHADSLTDPWLKRSMDEIAYGYWLLAAKVVKDERPCPRTRNLAHRSAYEAL
jgi:hypothetical protein